MKRLFTVVLLWAAAGTSALAADSCLECHRAKTPGAVRQWEESAHAAAKVGCSDCHGSDHGSIEEGKAVVDTRVCGRCHEAALHQHVASRHGMGLHSGWGCTRNLSQRDPRECRFCHEEGSTRPRSTVQCARFLKQSSEMGEAGCNRCHNVETSCASCHGSHITDLKVVRDPGVCAKCHMGPDHPQWEMWQTSKHGTIWQIEPTSGRAPTCQTCHMGDGSHDVKTSWGFLALRLPENDPEWLANRVTILQAIGVLDDKGQPTERLEVVKAGKVARLTKEEFDQERTKMVKACTQCHSKSYAEANLKAGDDIIREVDKIFAGAIRDVKGLYDDGILKKPAGWTYTPDLLQFYEAKTAMEQELYLIFLEYRQRAFQGAFHANPDYMHWYGWAKVKEAAARIHEEATKLRAEHKAGKH